MLSVEGGHALEGDLNVLRSLRALGVTSMTLTHANSNEFADSSQGERLWGGLSEMGRGLVEEMNRIGMLVDISHTSDETVEAALKCSKSPVFASHSCCRALCDHPRNLTDELIKKIARRGGVIQIAYYPPYLEAQAAAVFEGNWKKLRATWPSSANGQTDMAAFYAACMKGVPEVPISTLSDHIEHAVSVAGIDHVGLGSDWDGANIVVGGLENCAHLPRLTAALLKRGYRDRDIQKILGGNFVRFLKEVLG
jgi:membrane dipeptidase